MTDNQSIDGAAIRHASCALAANTVTITLTCATATAARALFRQVGPAVDNGQLSLALTGERGRP
ncbi:hypothetical protein RA307_30545 [Xanthobacteraceae bacterium Astr-EGSB]|uniref:hypothetical protein n=1 Tax=Astrobacterium formosum TaxID=3069710 RepID=UPI0027B71F7C|nr:hypothetical protein [Xanthobacteraceae bacterium Astr-EGSB]